MDLAKTKVPFRDDVRYFLDLPEGHKKKSCKYKFVWIVCFALTLGQAIFLTSTFVKVQNLEHQVKELKVQLDTFKNLIDFDLYSDDSEENNDNKVRVVNADDYLEDYDDDYSDDIVSEDLNIDQFMLKQNSTNTETFRPKRSVVAATRDGVLVNSESYAETKQRTETVPRGLHGVSITTLPARPSSFGDSPVWMTSRYYQPAHTITPTASSRPSPPPVLTRKSRVMHREDKSKAFRQVVKKSSLKAGDLRDSSEQSFTDAPFTVVTEESLGRRRRPRPRGRLESFDEHPRLGRIKPLPTVHYSGDTSRYTLGHHHNYKGNGHLMHLQEEYVDWKPNPWVHTLGMDQHFQLDNGVVTIKDTGLYFIYAQVYYLDEHDRNEYQVWKNDVVVLQCVTSTHTQHKVNKANTCFTAGAEHLIEGDKISLKDFSTKRYSIFEAGKSFFGLIKLGDIRIK